MALETLKNVDTIGGYGVVHILKEEDREGFRVEHIEGKHSPIVVDHVDNSITFFLQNKPIKEVGVNGCQVDSLIHAAFIIIDGFDKQLPCAENKEVAQCLFDALMLLKKRTSDRESRGVEGTNQP